MPKNLTKTDIKFDEARIFRVTPFGGPSTLHVSVGYTVITAEGETIQRTVEQELTGGQRTRAIDFLDGIKTAILTKEGL